MSTNETKAQHTPGPWEAKHWHGTIDDEDSQQAIWSQHGRIAQMDVGLPEEENEANARLIASAPALLAQRNELLGARAKRLDQERRYLASFHGADKLGGTATLLKAWITEDEAVIARAEKG